MQPVPSFFLEDKQIKRSQGPTPPIRKKKKYWEIKHHAIPIWTKKYLAPYPEEQQTSEHQVHKQLQVAEGKKTYSLQQFKLWKYTQVFHSNQLLLYLPSDIQSLGVWSVYHSGTKKFNNMVLLQFALIFLNSSACTPIHPLCAVWSSEVFHYWEVNFIGSNIGHAIASSRNF